MFKKIIKNYTFLVFLSLTLVFSSCSDTGDSKGNGVDFSNSFRGGDDSLVISFQEGSPPPEVFGGGIRPFNVRLLIKNEGERDIRVGEGFVVLSGIDPASFNLENVSKSIPEIRGYKIQGDSIIEGRQQIITFTNLKYLQNVSGKSTQRIYADICYPYKTLSLANLCVSDSPFLDADESTKICDVENSKSEFGNSAAPVSIENVGQYAAGSSSIVFQFDIVHKPKKTSSLVFAKNSFDSECRVNGLKAGDDYEKKNVVAYRVETGIEGLSCNGGENFGEAQLVNNKAHIICEQEISGERDHIRPVNIELEYGYFDRVSKDIVINSLR